MEKIQAGGKLYLRSLSRDKPSQAPADIDKDFPELAKDFVLPDELSFIRDKIHSSVLRVSGRVNMWLHYDVSFSPGPPFLYRVELLLLRFVHALDYVYIY